MHILAIVSRDLEKGSTKYRLAQYLDFLAENGVSVEFVRRNEIDGTTLESARRADLLFNQKCLINLRLAKKLMAASRRVLFDYDDAIYTRPGKAFSLLTQLKVQRRFHYWLRHADVVTTPNEFLARYAGQHGGSVKIIPMALDLKVWRPAPEKTSEKITIGWAGAPVNVHLLERLDSMLSSLLTRFPNAKLAVFSGQRPRLSCPFEYFPFEPGAEPGFVRSLDIGLLPLVNEEYSHGKSPIKALQYLASGIPVVGNVVGATAEILNKSNSIAVHSDEDWSTALETLIQDPGLVREMGRAGRHQVEKNNSYSDVAAQLLNIFQE